ncbi:EVE domain-containing protein, partial [Candidatus Cryosericum odellii]
MPTWLFQGSPKDFPAFDDYLRNYAEISWHVRQKRAVEEI